MGLTLWIKSLSDKFKKHSVSFIESIDKPVSAKKKREKVEVRPNEKSLNQPDKIEPTEYVLFENMVDFELNNDSYFNSKMKLNVITFAETKKTQPSGFNIAKNIFSEPIPSILTELKYDKF